MEKLAPGKYVVAVSGGVDSMVLLDMVRRQPGVQIIVAHADHGVRPDSQVDEQLVETYAAKHAIPLVTTRLELGPHPTEAHARRQRYEFLQHCCRKFGAGKILTAHHQDDLIETAMIAIIRGTGWRGLAPFAGRQRTIVRPLLSLTKNDIIAYARRHKITWREDSTNRDERYLRNYVRHTLVPLLDQKSASWRESFLQHIRSQQEVRKKVEPLLTKWLDIYAQSTGRKLSLPRYHIIMAPRPLAYEYLQQAFRQHAGNSFERPLAESAVLFTKVAKPRKLMELNQNWQLRAESANVIVEPRTP